MDIISVGDFAVTNKDGFTWMSYQYPSIERIDFVADIDNKRRFMSTRLHMNPDEMRRARNKRKAEARKRKKS
jgi:hypothetical protein